MRKTSAAAIAIALWCVPAGAETHRFVPTTFYSRGAANRLRAVLDPHLQRPGLQWAGAGRTFVSVTGRTA